jgi:hypothetical protein
MQLVGAFGVVVNLPENVSDILYGGDVLRIEIVPEP